jgi:hypothetical protein
LIPSADTSGESSRRKKFSFRTREKKKEVLESASYVKKCINTLRSRFTVGRKKEQKLKIGIKEGEKKEGRLLRCTET